MSKVKNTIKDWDMLAAQAINSVLAPKGFVKDTSKHWKGIEKARMDTPFLSKRKVVETRAITAQLIRNYRQEVRKAMDARLQTVNQEWDKATKELNAAKFWEFNKKREAQRAHDHYRTQSGLLQILINQLDTIEVK